jgi:hypothetical protein
MTNTLSIFVNRRCAVAALIWMLGVPLWGDDQKPSDVVGHYDVVASVFSYQSGDLLTTYRQYPSGSAEADATLMLEIGDQNRHFKLTVLPKLKSQRFVVTVKVSPEKQDTHTETLERKFDLTELSPQLVDIAHDADGRIYRLNLEPRMIQNPVMRQFKVSDLHLESWGFPASPVIVNDQDYIGQLSVSGGPLAWCDIPGLAKIEFSLLHLKNAEPLGTLSDGVINIKHPDGTTLRIANVKNGINGDTLSGGPYQVWVRWNKPTQSMEEYRELLKKQIAKFEQRIQEGDTSLSPKSLEQLKKMIQSDRVEVSSFGVTQVPPHDLAEPAE